MLEISTSYENAFSRLLYPLLEQSPVDVPRAVQNSNNLNAFTVNAVEDQIRELDQRSGLGRYVRPQLA